MQNGDAYTKFADAEVVFHGNSVRIAWSEEEKGSSTFQLPAAVPA